MSAACNKIFEDVGADPHPPTVVIDELTRFDSEATADKPSHGSATPGGVASSARAAAITFDSGGFTLVSGEFLLLKVSYTDAGGDIQKFTLQDRDGPLLVSFQPSEQTFFSGTAGTVHLPTAGIDPLTGLENPPTAGSEFVGILGRHRLLLWAEDSHLSRSEKVEFVITIVP
jgi:hypothetical protein